MNEDCQYKVGSAVTTRRNTTVKQDLRDIGRMLMGSRGGRLRRQAIDDRVDKAQTGRCVAESRRYAADASEYAQSLAC